MDWGCDSFESDMCHCCEIPEDYEEVDDVSGEEASHPAEEAGGSRNTSSKIPKRQFCCCKSVDMVEDFDLNGPDVVFTCNNDGALVDNDDNDGWETTGVLRLDGEGWPTKATTTEPGVDCWGADIKRMVGDLAESREEGGTTNSS